LKLKGFIFDLDGTLLNSSPVCISGLRAAFRQYLGRDFSDHRL